MCAEQVPVKHDQDALAGTLGPLQHERGACALIQPLHVEREPVQDVIVSSLVALGDVVQQVALKLGPTVGVVGWLHRESAPGIQFAWTNAATGREIDSIVLATRCGVEPQLAQWHTLNLAGLIALFWRQRNLPNKLFRKVRLLQECQREAFEAGVVLLPDHDGLRTARDHSMGLAYFLNAGARESLFVQLEVLAILRRHVADLPQEPRKRRTLERHLFSCKTEP